LLRFFTPEEHTSATYPAEIVPLEANAILSHGLEYFFKS
jgi:hypothetical protein